MTIYWFKRDLRLEDNTALSAALDSGDQVLFLYIYEPSLWNDAHYSERHERYISESLTDLQGSLERYGSRLLLVKSEVVDCLELLLSKYKLKALYSHEETGLAITYERDIAVQKLCKEHGIPWYEFQSNGVKRRARNRITWSQQWYRYMTAAQETPEFDTQRLVSAARVDEIADNFDIYELKLQNHTFQRGGETVAHEVMTDFFENRLEFYSAYISKPEESRIGCSRLSPYISWGNLSIRQVYQKVREKKQEGKFKRELNAISARLRWQSHFIQKFEQEPRQEFEALNKGFLDLDYPVNKKYIEAWKSGMTGYPLVDASMRAVAETGYLNFRMRAMLVSFLTHHLFQHFTTGSAWLAKQFLDFEAGIHYPQFQMQAGLTGTNTVRVYNPTKNAQDHDPEAIFIKKYIPELADLPAKYAIEPWLLEGEIGFGFEYGVDYPRRIVDISETRKHALTKLYGQRKSDLARAEKQRILEVHSIPRKS
jgi:deoxyribodipyrimidine photo-lyase